MPVAFRQHADTYSLGVGEGKSQAADRSITFESARVLSQTASAATVAVTTTSVRTNSTQHCGWTVDLHAGGTWLLHLIHITCSSKPT
jgi:hypothetical protein